MFKVLFGIVGFIIGLVVASNIFGIGFLALLTTAVITVVFVKVAPKSKRQQEMDAYVDAVGDAVFGKGFCKSCLDIPLSRGTVRNFVNSDVYHTFDGKLVMVAHLEDGCSSCKQKARNHAKDFARKHNIDFNVDGFFDGYQKKRK